MGGPAAGRSKTAAMPLCHCPLSCGAIGTNCLGLQTTSPLAPPRIENGKSVSRPTSQKVTPGTSAPFRPRLPHVRPPRDGAHGFAVLPLATFDSGLRRLGARRVAGRRHLLHRHCTRNAGAVPNGFLAGRPWHPPGAAEAQRPWPPTGKRTLTTPFLERRGRRPCSLRVSRDGRAILSCSAPGRRRASNTGWHCHSRLWLHRPSRPCR